MVGTTGSHFWMVNRRRLQNGTLDRKVETIIATPDRNRKNGKLNRAGDTHIIYSVYTNFKQILGLAGQPLKLYLISPTTMQWLRTLPLYSIVEIPSQLIFSISYLSRFSPPRGPPPTWYVILILQSTTIMQDIILSVAYSTRTNRSIMN